MSKHITATLTSLILQFKATQAPSRTADGSSIATLTVVEADASDGSASVEQHLLVVAVQMGNQHLHQARLDARLPHCSCNAGLGFNLFNTVRV